MQGFDSSKELELYAELLEREIKRREHRVSHARLHLPDERTFPGKRHTNERAKRDPSADVGLVRVAVDVGKLSVVHEVRPRRIEHEIVVIGRVFCKPSAIVLLVEAIKTVLEDVVYDGSAEVGKREVHHDPRAPDAGVVEVGLNDLPEEAQAPRGRGPARCATRARGPR